MENDGLLNDGARMFQGQVLARAARAGAPRREHGLVGARFARARSNLDARAAFFRARRARASSSGDSARQVAEHRRAKRRGPAVDVAFASPRE